MTDSPHDQCDGRHPHPRSRRAHLRAGRVRDPLRLGRRGDQDRTRRARRRDARIDEHRARRPGRVGARVERAREPRQEEPRARPHQRAGIDILYQLAATCDVFLTNKMAGVRERLHIEVDDIRAHNPNIIYVRGTGTATWARRRRRRLRLPRVLGPGRLCRRGDARRPRRDDRPARARLRRLDRRHDHRGWHRRAPATGSAPAKRTWSTCHCWPRVCGRWGAGSRSPSSVVPESAPVR